MGFFKFKNVGPSTAENTELVRPYFLKIDEIKFIETKTCAIFERILKRCFHKTSGISDKEINKISMSMFLSVEYGAQKNGTIPLVARAMTGRRKIYLIYDRNAGLTRCATLEEQQKIIKSYEDNNNSIAYVDDGKRGICQIGRAHV